jgi:hypothetical protein
MVDQIRTRIMAIANPAASPAPAGTRPHWLIWGATNSRPTPEPARDAR